MVAWVMVMMVMAVRSKNDSRCILKAELTEFADGLDVG